MLLNEKQVKEYGRELGTKLGPGDVVALIGELGAGKTTLAKAIAEGLGITDHVISPTFTIVGEYKSGRLPLYHFDVYRLGSPDEKLKTKELSEIGYEEYFFGAGVTVIEWADRIEELLPEHSLRVELSHTDDPGIREVIITEGSGGKKDKSERQKIKRQNDVFHYQSPGSAPNLPMLAIETTGPICSVALAAADGRVFHRASDEGLMHLTTLIPLVEELTGEAGLKPKRLGQIAVSAGPGSFTGMRIGVATARALAQTLDVPVVKVPTLETFVYMNDIMRPFTVACPVFDARRDQMYAGAYMLEEDGRVMTLVKGGAYAPDEFFAILSASMTALKKLAERVGGPEASVLCRLMGDGLHVFQNEAEKYMNDAAALGIETEMAPLTQDARATMAWAIAHGVPIEYEFLEPIYIRKAEAQRRLEEKNAEEEARYQVRPAEESDVYGISIIERLSFGEPWLEQSISNDIKLEYSDYVVCENEGCIFGYAGLYRILDEGHITNIAVHPGSRRKGIGSAALEELMRRAEAQGITSFTLEVRDSAKETICFYEKHGFVSEGIRKDYYPAGGGEREDACLMWRHCQKDPK